MRNGYFMAIHLLCGIAILLSACNRNYVSLDHTNARGEVPQLGNLVFRFNKSLYPDTLINKWDSTEYVSFSPAIAGHFRWNGPDELVFSPAAPLKPATSYKATFNEELLRYSKYNEVQHADDISFHTAALMLNDAQVTWVLQEEGSRTGIPQISLQFNYSVKADDLRDHLQVEVDGGKAEYTLQNTGSGNTMNIRLDHFKAEDRNYEAQISIEKGLKPEKGANSTEEAIRTSLSIPSPYVLNIGNVESEHDGMQGLVHIYTTQQLSSENIARYISFDPAVKFTVEKEEYGITLRSDQFDAENSYSLKIGSGLPGVSGGVLKETYYGSVAFGKLEPDVKFTSSKAVYLSKNGGGNIEVRITNTQKVKLVISRIYENNLLMAGRYGYMPQDEEDTRYASYDEEGGYSNDGDAQAGDVIYTREIDTRTLPKSGSGRLLNVSQFEDRLPDTRGIYHVMIRSTKDYWVRDSRFISLSDIGLIARQGQDKIYVFANSIKTAHPMAGVTVRVYGANNQLLGTGSTNADGAAEVPVTVRNFTGFRPAMVIASTANDFTYLPFNNTMINTSRFDVGGKRSNATGLDAFVYAERDIYRPGERVNFSVLLRDKTWKATGEIPVKLRFLLPNGKELKSFRKTLNEQGGLDGSIDLSAAAITGSYTLEVYSSNEVLLATKNFMIEEFVPDRIKLSARLDKPFLRPREKASLVIHAVNFFGPPATHRNYEIEIQVRQRSFSPKKFPGYDFSLINERSFFDKDVREGKTDENGNATESFEVPDLYVNTGLLQVNFYTTVFDETGRPVSRHTTTDIYTQNVFNGIRDDGYYYYALNQPVKFGLLSVDKDGEAVAATSRVQVIKHEYRTVLTRSGGYFRYDSQKEDRVMADQEMTVGNNTVFNYIPRSPGNYEVRVYRPGGNAYVSKSFYSYGSWGADNTSFEVNTEGHIDIEPDKNSYQAGETARFLFKTPFSGRLLVTVETDHVVTYRYLDVTKRTATMDLRLGSDFVPNIYITATLIKPHEVSDIPLTVAHGFQHIMVEEKNRKIGVEIMAQKTARSRTHQQVSVKAAPGSYVTLAAVDNGVLQITDFQTPDPYAYYYQKRALQVTGYDMYPLLFPELRARLSSTGGDGDLSLDKRVNPMPARRFKIMSYWSGMQKVNSSGIARFEYDIPQFSGQVRLMAVAFRDDRFGSAEATTTVADPIVLSSALPRFISPGDTLFLPVTLSNTTGREAEGKVSLTVTGPLKIIGEGVQSARVEAKSEGRAGFHVAADQLIGVARVAVRVDALGERFLEETEISVRPPSGLQKIAGSGSVAAGSIHTIAVPKNDFIQGSLSYDLVVSRSPVVEMADQLRYLVQYPYGCTEQTVSAAFPQLYFSDMADLLGKKNQKQSAQANVIEAIRKVKMRQLYNGAVTLWDGEGTENWWATVYAAHFLLEARKAGFDVDNNLMETLLSYLANRLKTRETIEYYYNRDQRRKIAPKEVAYSLYVLALAGKAQVSAMNYYKANPQLLALDSKYLLSAAYAAAGDRRSYLSLLPASFSGEESVQQTGGSFYSFLRDEAVALNSLLDTDPGNAQIPVMAKHVSDLLRKDPYPNTQERAFSFLALGKMARVAGQSNVTAEIRSNGKVLATVARDWKGSSDKIGLAPVEIIARGNGRIYYSWVAEGISASGAYREEDNYIKVGRRFFDRYGNPVTGNTFRQNDLVIIELTLDKFYNTPIENLVLTDLLPAGFEIENPRTRELPGMDWIKNASEPVALDVRDDRIHFFVHAEQPRQKYYYAVRAVSPGVFRQGPVGADALYDGAIHSYHGAQTIRIVQ